MSGKRNGPSSNRGKRRAKFDEKYRPEALAFAVVPGCRFEGIDLCLRRNLERRHLPTGPEVMLYSRNELWPRLGFFSGSAMRGETVVQESVLPPLKGT